MEVIIGVAGKGDGGQATRRHIDPQFFLQFPDQGDLGCLIIMDFAAGEFPQARHGFSHRAFCQQHPSIGIHQSNSRNQNNRHPT